MQTISSKYNLHLHKYAIIGGTEVKHVYQDNTLLKLILFHSVR